MLARAAPANSRWLANDAAGAATAFGNAPSADAEIHYSGLVNVLMRDARDVIMPLTGGASLFFALELLSPVAHDAGKDRTGSVAFNRCLCRTIGACYSHRVQFTRSVGPRLPPRAAASDGQSCCYCGAPAQSAAPNTEWEQRAPGQPVHYVCSRCGLVYSEVILAALPTMPDGLTPDAQVEALVAFTSEIDRLVRERVRE